MAIYIFAINTDIATVRKTAFFASTGQAHFFKYALNTCLYDFAAINTHHNYQYHTNHVFGAARNSLLLVGYHIPWPVSRGGF